MSSVPEAAASTPPHLAAQPLFSAYTLGAAHDEMFDAQGQPRAQYQALYDRLRLALVHLAGAHGLHRGRVAGSRTRPDPAHHRPQPVPEGRL
jgi:hypothetical protein